MLESSVRLRHHLAEAPKDIKNSKVNRISIIIAIIIFETVLNRRHLQRGLIRALMSPLVYALIAQVRPIGTDGEPQQCRLGRRGGALVLQGIQLRAAANASC